MSFRPVAVIDVDLAHPRELRLGGYDQAKALVRVAGVPVAVRWVSVLDGVLGSEEAHSQIWQDHKTLLAARHSGKEASEMAWPKIDVIICTRLRTESLNRTLDSLLACDYPDFKIYVVDNGPHLPDTRNLIDSFNEKLQDPIYYVAESNRGLSRARNTGMAHATSDILAMTDDDVLVDRGWLKAVASAFAAEPDAVCVTGPVLGAELETEAQLIFERKGGFNTSFERKVHTLAERPADQPLYPFSATIFGTGANMAFRRSRLPDGFQFDPLLGAGTITKGGEDMDIFVDVLYHGGTVVFEPTALIYHYHRKNMDALATMMRGYGTGFGAYLTKQLFITERRRDLLRCLPAARSYNRRPASRTSFSNDYPAYLTRQEILGLLAGPFRYFYARLKHSLTVRRGAARRR